MYICITTLTIIIIIILMIIIICNNMVINTVYVFQLYVFHVYVWGCGSCQRLLSRPAAEIEWICLITLCGRIWSCSFLEISKTPRSIATSPSSTVVWFIVTCRNVPMSHVCLVCTHTSIEGATCYEKRQRQIASFCLTSRALQTLEMGRVTYALKYTKQGNAV